MASNINIDTTSLGIDWQLGETYRVAIDEGFVVQDGGLQLPIDGDDSVTTFTTPTTVPKITNTDPSYGATAEKGFTEISFDFDRTLLDILTGNVYLYDEDQSNLLIQTSEINDVISGNTVTLDIVGNINPDTNYFVTIDANIVQDKNGYKNNSITDNSEFKFLSPTAPEIETYYPEQLGNLTLTQANIVVTFDRDITSANIGNLYVYETSGNILTATYDLSTDATFTANSFSIPTYNTLTGETDYYITIDANVAYDNTEIYYPGLSNSSQWTFTTVSDVPSVPTIVSVTAISNVSANITYTASEYTGGQEITSYTGISDPGNISGTTFTANSGNITVTGLSPATNYKFQIYATNSAGNSNVSPYSATIKTFDKPNAPTIGLAVLTSTTTASIEYTESTLDNGGEITSYTAISTPGNITGTTTSLGDAINVTGLTANVNYTFQVYSTNAYGNSALSSSSNGIFDAYWYDTQLLIRGEDFTDDSQNNYSVSYGAGLSAGNLTISKFGLGSIKFNGSDYLSVATTSNLEIPGDFTWEAWIYPTAFTAKPFPQQDTNYPAQIIGTDNDYGRFNLIISNTNYLVVQSSDASSGWEVDINPASSTNSIPFDTWKHVAVTRSGNTWRTFVDGTLTNTTTSSSFTPESTQNLIIGNNYNNTAPFTGHMEGIRFTKGVARYTSSFTVSTYPWPYIA